jgi:rhodanese-related sulfurtransferase
MPFYCIEGGASVTNDLFLFIGILSGPTVALIYSLSIWIAYALSHEIPWISKLPDILVPVSILQVAAIACSLALVICDDDDDDDDGNENDQAEAHFGSGRVALLKQIIPTIFFWMASIYYMRWIRIHEVVGISNTRPFYGEFHLEGKVVLITGANAGIGKETAAQLASMGCSTIVFLCRSEARAAKAIRALVQRGVGKEEQFQFCPCDLGDFASIRKAVDRIQSKLSISAVDVLINNAGLLMGTKTISKDGYELMMQANHLGHFLLTQLLLGRGVLQNDKSRIINLTSSTYKLAKDGFDFDDIFCDKRRKYTMFGKF